jgi:hypothetical protein
LQGKSWWRDSHCFGRYCLIFELSHRRLNATGNQRGARHFNLRTRLDLGRRWLGSLISRRSLDRSGLSDNRWLLRFWLKRLQQLWP